jgi:hypothetical protein
MRYYPQRSQGLQLTRKGRRVARVTPLSDIAHEYATECHDPVAPYSASFRRQ